MRKTVIDLIRGQVVKRLVKTVSVVKVEPIAEAVAELGPVGKRVKINVVVLQRPPQPLYENIVLHPAPAVHANGNSVVFEFLDKALTGELRALVGVENLRAAVAPDRLGKSLDPKVGLQSIGYLRSACPSFLLSP